MISNSLQYPIAFETIFVYFSVQSASSIHRKTDFMLRNDVESHKQSAIKYSQYEFSLFSQTALGLFSISYLRQRMSQSSWLDDFFPQSEDNYLTSQVLGVLQKSFLQRWT